MLRAFTKAKSPADDRSKYYRIYVVVTQATWFINLLMWWKTHRGNKAKYPGLGTMFWDSSGMVLGWVRKACACQPERQSHSWQLKSVKTDQDQRQIHHRSEPVQIHSQPESTNNKLKSIKINQNHGQATSINSSIWILWETKTQRMRDHSVLSFFFP